MPILLGVTSGITVICMRGAASSVMLLFPISRYGSDGVWGHNGGNCDLNHWGHLYLAFVSVISRKDVIYAWSYNWANGLYDWYRFFNAFVSVYQEAATVMLGTTIGIAVF